MSTRIGSLLAWHLLVATSGCHSQDASGRQYTRIDDMEHSGAAFTWGDRGLRGLWYASTKCVEPPEGPLSNISPLPYFEEPDGWAFDRLVTPHETFPEVTSYLAARLRTTGDGLISTPAKRIWGANLNVDLVQPSVLDGGVALDGGGATTTTSCPNAIRDFPGAPVDLSSYSGLVFWAKAQSTLERRIQIMVHDLTSDPRGNQCNNGNFASLGAKSDWTACYNGFLTTRELSDEFKQYEIDFSELRRDPTWGYQPPSSAIDVNQIYLIVFQVNSLHCVLDPNAKCVAGVDGGAGADAGVEGALNFDFSIDDLYLVKRQ